MEIGSPFDDFEYICHKDIDKAPEKQRKLIGRHLTVRQHALLGDIGSEMSNKGYILNTGTSNLMCFHLGLVKMVNFFDREGKAIVLKRDETKPESLPVVGRPWEEDALDYIPPLDFLRFASKIKNGEDIDEAEAKNS